MVILERGVGMTWLEVQEEFMAIPDVLEVDSKPGQLDASAVFDKHSQHPAHERLFGNSISAVVPTVRQRCRLKLAGAAEGDDDAVLLSHRRELCKSSRPLNRQFAQRTFHYTFRVSSPPETRLHRASICGVAEVLLPEYMGQIEWSCSHEDTLYRREAALAATRRKSSSLLVTLIACG